ncbi:MAG: hypothetical protein CFE21_08295 [Bacteroidetes bacterium B1(2017)]|nr:MAG: hypothetical protein CFE21_08295 [Bacteroidetes bacterium B1(2017)]
MKNVIVKYKKAGIVSILIGLSILVQTNTLLAQDQENKHPLRGAIMMANSHVPNQTSTGKQNMVIPTWGFDLDYGINKKWSLGLQSDIKLQSFSVEEKGVQLERSNPLALAFVAHYYPIEHWSFYTGPGYEFEQHKNLKMWKLGTEYSFEITEKFEIALNLIYENKEEIYDTWTFGIAFNRRLN